MKRAIVVSALVALMAGCFPISVSVAPDGRMVLVREEGVVVYDLKHNTANVIVKSEDRKAAWAAFSKDGKQIMYVLAEGDQPKDVFVCKSDGTDSKKIYTGGQALAYACWSPDGKYVTVGEVQQNTKNDLPNLIDLKLVTVESGEAKPLADDAVQIHGWLADSSGVVTFLAEGMMSKAAKPEGNEEKGDNNQQEQKAPRGKLVRVALDGTRTTLAEVVLGKNPCVDCSHDGKDVLFTASATGAPGAALTLPEKPDDAALFDYSFADKKTKQVREATVESAFFSPDDKHVLISKGGDPKNLIVTDRVGNNATFIATGMLNATEAMMDSARVLPAWLSNDTVIYWRSRVTIGFKGASINTMTVKIDGSEKTSIQTKLDSLLEK